MAIQASIVTRNTDEISEKSGNVYESIVIIGKRARQVPVQKN